MMKNICFLSFLVNFLLVFSVEAQVCDLMQPSDPNIPVPPTIYHSPLRGYQSFEKVKLKSWRQANDQVKQSDHAMGHRNMKNMNMQEQTFDHANDVDHSLHMNH